MLISCFSFTEVSKEASKIMKEGGSMLTLTYESTKAIPNYNVMGVCKSALEASVKYLARDLGQKKISMVQTIIWLIFKIIRFILFDILRIWHSNLIISSIHVMNFTSNAVCKVT